MRRNVLIYRDRLTYLSEAFIFTQGESLRQYRPYYVGVRSEPGVPMPADRTTLLCTGSWLDWPREAAFKVAGRLPAAFRRLKQLDPHLLHAHFGPDGVRAIPIARAFAVPLVVSFHGFDATVHDRALRQMNARAMRSYPRTRARLQIFGSRFIAVSAFVRRKLLERGFPEERVIVHYIGVDTRFFRPTPGVREPVILFVGRLIEQKGITDFIRAVTELQRSGIAVQGVVIGVGPAEAGARQLARSLDASITFVGAQPQLEVRHWMQRSQIFCVPSRRMPSGAEEGFGLVFAEAQAAGLPVVSYANGGIVEAVADKRTGFLAPDGDWRQIARHLAQLVQNGDLQSTFSAAATERARKLFDLASQTVALERIYHDVIAEAAHGTVSAQPHPRAGPSPAP